ncbi:MAG: exo-alpha-sialidase [Planctomycetes bacterium]|nr:exo-alpha-sialidase [Planctomycetota bacterium]
MTVRSGACSMLLAILVIAGNARGGDVTPVVAPGVLPEARQPQVAVDAQGRVYVAFGCHNAVYCAISEDGGHSFRPPVMVAEVPGLALGARRGPRIAASKEFVTITAACGSKEAPSEIDIRCWCSPTAGKTWFGPVSVNSVHGSGREGLQAIAAGPSGEVLCAWLDLRRGKTDLYGSRSEDGGRTWSADSLVYRSLSGSICECCHPSVWIPEKGKVFVMWRNSLSGARDLYVSESIDDGRTFGKASKLGEGTWNLEACPMDGGALASEADGSVVGIWMRKNEVFLAGAGKPERRLGKGGQPWAARGPDGLYCVWLEKGEGKLLVLKPRMDAPTEIARGASDPVVASSIDGRGPVIAAWEADSGGVRASFVCVLVERNP